ncbi:MAG: hypothetical protein WBW14_27365, partial [Candidatus Acidiferrum sp.]
MLGRKLVLGGLVEGEISRLTFATTAGRRGALARQASAAALRQTSLCELLARQLSLWRMTTVIIDPELKM